MEIPAAESAWLAARSVAGPINRCKAELQKCWDQISSEEVKMPLNVACSDVLRGVITRRGDSINVAGHAHFHHHQFDFQSATVPHPQIALLLAALARCIVELSVLTGRSEASTVLTQVQAAHNALATARKQLTVPERGFRFPQKFFGLGEQVPTGYCGEVFACEEHNLVFNLHAYQDRAQTYVATDTISVKGTDPQLHEMWRVLNSRVVQDLEVVAQQLEAVLPA